MDYRDHILQMVSMKGPILPAHINRDLKRDLIFTAAMLSELVDNKKMKLTRLKVGGSPLYYLPGQEHRLQYFSKHLHEKEQKAYELLRTNKILADREQEPVIRAALREIKDFAMPLDVTTGGATTLFWKWYLLPPSEAETLIKEKMLGVQTPTASVPSVSPASSSPLSAIPFPLSSSPSSVFDAIQEHKKQLLQELSNVPQQIPVSEQKQPPTPLPSSPHSSLLSSSQPVPVVVPLQELVAGKKQKKKKTEKEKRVEFSDHQELQQKLSEEQELFAPLAEPTDDDFYHTVKKYFDANTIIIKKLSIIRKNSELEADISVASAVGPLAFYCRAKNKQRCSEGDLSTVFLEGQRRKLPVLFLITGEITKKATTLLSSEFTTITIKNL